MALILAVEPDRQQASHIVAVLRGRPRTELVIAESVAAALKAIAARVPDLLLASPLLSRQDEARLAEWLRGLGPAAAHVQALTIPILATTAPETTRGMLSMLRRRRPRTSSPAGCEPAMFASQVGLYLERASREQAEEPAATTPSQPPPEPAAEWQAAAIEPEPEPAIARIDTAVSRRIEAGIALAARRADEESRWVSEAVAEVREEPAPVPETATAEPVTDGMWMLTPGPATDELVAAAPPDSPETAEFILLIPIYDLPPELVVEASVSAPAAAIETPAPGAVVATPEVLAAASDAVAAIPDVVAAAPEAVAAPAVEPDPEPAMASIHLVVSSRIEAEIGLASLPAEEDSPGVAAPFNEVPEWPVGVPAPEWPVAAIEVAAPPAWPSAIEAHPPEPAVAAIESDTPEQIEALIALAALRAHEEAQWLAVPLEDLEEGPGAMPEGPAQPFTDDVWMLTPAPHVDELVAAAPADPRHTAPVIRLTTVYDRPSEPVVEARVCAPAVDVEMPAPEVAAAPAHGAAATSSPATTRRKKVEKAKKPVQDEWGFFDPGQCGFAALLDKLDEITAQETAAERRRDDVDVRVISY